MESKVKDHYNTDNLVHTIKVALVTAKKDLSDLQLKDLSPIDQLHTGGARSSIELLKKARLFPGALVLDAGCGIGGSSRLLAKNFNCKVIGIDLADRFIEAAAFLTQGTHLENQVEYQQGSVLELPFEDHFFDAVLCQHILMNIEDKSSAIKEFSRVLKPGGRLILHEITQGDNTPLLFPVPWAANSSISYLEPWDTLFAIIEAQGFETEFYSDETRSAGIWWEKVRTVSQEKSPEGSSLGPGLIFGKNAKVFGKNMSSNLKNNSICLIEAILKKKYTESYF